MSTTAILSALLVACLFVQTAAVLPSIQQRLQLHSPFRRSHSNVLHQLTNSRQRQSINTQRQDETLSSAESGDDLAAEFDSVAASLDSAAASAFNSYNDMDEAAADDNSDVRHVDNELLTGSELDDLNDVSVDEDESGSGSALASVNSGLFDEETLRYFMMDRESIQRLKANWRKCYNPDCKKWCEPGKWTEIDCDWPYSAGGSITCDWVCLTHCKDSPACRNFVVDKHNKHHGKGDR